MNEFTKEELEILNDALLLYEKRLYGNESHTRFSSLLNMIGRMIDNYCDPEFDAMLISTKQIVQLYDVARMCAQVLIRVDNDEHESKIEYITNLLSEIRKQQPLGLKEVE